MLSRRTLLLATCLLAINSLGQVLCAAEPLRLRVLSYNIHHGEGTDGRLDLKRIARVIKRSQADVVALQEVDNKTKRTRRVDQTAELARLLGWQGQFGRSIDLGSGQYGNAVLTRLEIKGHRVHALPNPAGGEARSVLEVKLSVAAEKDRPAAEFVLLNTHFDHTRDERNRMASARFINKLSLATGKAPVLLAGDLNATPTSKPLAELGRNWSNPAAGRKLPTIPSARPLKQIDYVLLRPAKRWKIIEQRVIDEPVASDHRPILAVFELLAESK